jgi:hypothetical protein
MIFDGNIFSKMELKAVFVLATYFFLGSLSGGKEDGKALTKFLPWGR